MKLILRDIKIKKTASKETVFGVIYNLINTFKTLLLFSILFWKANSLKQLQKESKQFQSIE